MKWKPPTERSVNILVAPIAIPVVLIAAPVILACVPVWWALDKYETWLFGKGSHRWFAWHPVKTGDCFDRDRRWIWLETVEREALTYPNRETIYREIPA
jgi:hypothetical protein